MNGYADLSMLVPVMDTIFGYLNVKDQVKFKSVCRSWKAEIERREAKSDTLILHCGPYLLNVRWSPASGRGLMKYENSFEMKSISILDHPMTISRLQKIKKLAIVHLSKGLVTPLVEDIQNNLQAYIGHFEQCEEIELRNFMFRRTLILNLFKLKVLVVDSTVPTIVLNCPSLEVLCWTWKIPKIIFHDVKNLKRIYCFSWPKAAAMSADKFESLEYLNLFSVGGENGDALLMARMPKLRRLVAYSNDPQSDLPLLRKQAKQCGLNDLEMLFAGFRGPVLLNLRAGMTGFVLLDRCAERLFENYSKLVENSPWALQIDYSKLFNSFKILPSDFAERFSELFELKISEVTNYTHLLGFLKCYPAIQKLRIHWSKVNADRVLNLMFSLQPSLNGLTIVEDRPSDLLKIDLSFMRLFNLVILAVHSTRIPIEFVRRVAAIRGAYFNALMFEEIGADLSGEPHQIGFYFDNPSNNMALIDTTCDFNNPKIASLEQLIVSVKRDPHLAQFFI